MSGFLRAVWVLRSYKSGLLPRRFYTGLLQKKGSATHGATALGSAPGRLRPTRLADRRCVLDAAFVPQIVQAARQLQGGFGADIALKNLAVVAGSFDGIGQPFFL